MKKKQMTDLIGKDYYDYTQYYTYVHQEFNFIEDTREGDRHYIG